MDIGVLPRIDVAFDQGPDVLVAEFPKGELLAPLGDALLDNSASALERRVDRCDGGLQAFGYLTSREPQHVPHDQHGSLFWRAGAAVLR